jgi:hypothetical protein
MTFAEMGEQLDLELDESGGLWFNDDEKSVWLNKAVDKFVKNVYLTFEVDEASRERLRLLVKTSALQSGSAFDLSLITDLFFLLSLTGSFTVTSGGSSHLITRRIVPQELDDLDDQDPFSKGTNADPRYESVGEVLTIKSVTPPANVYAQYLKRPKVVDIVGSPTDVLDIPIPFHDEIVDFARDMALENMGSPRYATAKNETREN